MKRPGGSKSTAQILTGTMRSGVHLALTRLAALGLFRFQTTDRLWGLICEHYRRHFKTFTWWERWRVTSKQTLSEVLCCGKPRNHQPSTQHSSVSSSHAIKTAGRRVTDVWIHMYPPPPVHSLQSRCPPSAFFLLTCYKIPHQGLGASEHTHPTARTRSVPTSPASYANFGVRIISWRGPWSRRAAQWERICLTISFSALKN